MVNMGFLRRHGVCTFSGAGSLWSGAEVLRPCWQSVTVVYRYEALAHASNSSPWSQAAGRANWDIGADPHGVSRLGGVGCFRCVLWRARRGTVRKLIFCVPE